MYQFKVSISAAFSRPVYLRSCLLILLFGVAFNSFARQNIEAVTGLTAVHRNGQTFLTWREPDSNTQYHVYRHTTPISTANIAQAKKLTGRWGALGADTSVNVHGVSSAPEHFVVSDLGAPLSDSTGLFVYTAQPDESAAAYYAVTSVQDGVESKKITAGGNATVQAVNEVYGTPAPVLTATLNNGKGRLYTQYMDYTNWNPTFNGYAYNYSVALPASYNSSQPYALAVVLHAYGEEMLFIGETEYGYPVIQLFVSDPGESQGATNSWWYGYSADHDYKEGNPVGGVIENFTEQRVIKAIDEVLSNRDFNVDPELIYAYGNSMGASGVLSLAMRYSNVLAGVYANQPMTNYLTSPVFRGDFERLWGNPQANLPVVNRGPHSENIKRYGVGGSTPVGVWDWMNHQKQLVERRGDSFAYLMLSHGKADTTIDWATQGQPIINALTVANAGFSAASVADAGHTWLGFVAVNTELFGFGYDENFPWRYPRGESFPAIQNATGSGSINPGPSGNESYNLNIEWSTSHTPFAKPVVDKAGRYEITLRSLDQPQSADITPRNTKRFKPLAGQQCKWGTGKNNSKSDFARGVVTVDRDALVTIPDVEIRTDGTRLTIDCPTG